MQGYRIGAFTLDVERQHLIAGDRAIPLPRKSFEILRELAAAQGRPVPRDALTAAVWPDTSVEEATLRQHVYGVRSVFRELDPSCEYVETVPRIGYRLAAAVEPVIEPEAIKQAPERPASRRWWWTAAASVALVAMASWLIARGGHPALLPPPEPASTAPAELSRQGWAILDRRDAERFPVARVLFDRALEIDPRYAAALSGRAVLFTLRNDRAAAESDAALALAISPLSGQPLAVRGFFLMMQDWNWAAAGPLLAEAAQRACQPEPVCFQWQALYLALTGQLDKAVRTAADSIEYAPTSVAPRAQYGQILYWAGRTQSAIDELNRTLELGGVATHARLHLWKAYLAAGDRAAAAHAALVGLEPAWYRLPANDEVRVLYEDRAAWERPEFWSRLLDAEKRLRVNAYFLAELSMAAGQPTQALQYLEATVNQRNFFVPFARRDPIFAPLRNEPRFRALMQKIGLP